MAHAEFTADGKQYFKVVDQIISKFREVQKLNTEMRISARMQPGSLTTLRGTISKGAQVISKSTYVDVRVRAVGVAEVAKRIKDAYAKGIQAKITPYVTNNAIRSVKDRITAGVGKITTVEVGLRFQTGAAGKFRDTVKKLLRIISNSSYVEAELRLKQASLNQLKGKTVTLDVDVKAGTAAKIKALLELLKSLRQGAKIPVKLDIDSGLQALLKQLGKDLKTAADQASRLNQRLGSAVGASNQLSDAGGRVGGVFGRVQQALVALGVGTLIIQGIHLAVNGLRDALFDFPAQIQQIKIGFEGMLGSQERANDALAKMKAFAVPTPFETQDLARGGQQAVAFGLVDKQAKDVGDQIVSLMRDIGDASFGLGRGQEGVDRFLLALGQMKVATRVMGQEMLQMQQLGVNAWKYLSEATGKSTREVKDLVSKGLIPADKAIRAIREGIRRDFGGAMMRASKTALGAIAQIKDTLRVRLSDNFSKQFEQLSDALVRAADYMGSADFSAKLDAIGDAAQNTIERISKAWQFLSDLYSHNSGIIDAGLLAIGTRLLWLGAVARGGPFGALISLASIAGLVGQRTDQIGTAARALQPVLYGLAAAYIAVRVAATGAAVAQTVGAGLTAGIAAAQRLVSIFRFISATSGPVAATNAMLVQMTAQIAPLALYALPLLVAALGVAAIGYETYQAKAARVTAANADLNYSIGEVKKAFDSLSQVTAVIPGAGDKVQQLREQYDKLGGSLEGLQAFKGRDLALARGSVVLDTKLKPLERQVLLDELDRIQGQIDSQIQAAKFKVECEAEANPLSLQNMLDAFKQTWGTASDFWRLGFVEPYVTQGRWAFGQVAYFASTSWAGLSKGASDFFVGWNKGWGDLWDNMVGTGDTMAGRLFDGLTRAFESTIGFFKNQWSDFQRWLLGQSDNGTEDPGLPSVLTPAQVAEQKRKNAAWKASQRSKSGPFGGVGSGSSGHATGMTFAQVVAANPESFTPEQRRQALIQSQQTTTPGITPFNPDAGTPGKHHKTAAEIAAERAAREQLKREKDMLADTARAYDLKAKAAEQSAKAVVEATKSELDALKTLRDAFKDVFSSLQNEFVALGVIDDPLGPMIRNFEQLLDISGKSKAAVAGARKVFDQAVLEAKNARSAATNARSQSERISGLDGVVPGQSGALVGGGSIGDQIAQNAVNMQRKWGERIGKVFYKQCDRLADVTVNGATKAFARIMGPRGGDTAAKTMARFKAAGIGFRPGADYSPVPGDIVYSGARYGHGSGHVQVIGPDGRYYDQYKAHKRPTTPPQWIVRSGSSGGQGGSSPTSTGGNWEPAGAGETLEFGLSKLDGSMTKIAAVDAAWGKAVKNIEGNSARFALQTALASKEFQASIQDAATRTGKTVPEIIKWLRDFANTADAKLNRVKALDAVNEQLRELQKTRKALGTEDNPLASILAEFDAGGKYANAPEKRIQLMDAARALAMDQLSKATRETTEAERRKIEVLKAAAPFLNQVTIGTDAYERATERATRRFEAWSDKQVQGNLQMAQSYDVQGGAALRMATQLEKVARDLQSAGVPTGDLFEVAGQFRAQGKGLKGRAAGVRAKVNSEVSARLGAADSSADYSRGEERRKENLETLFDLDQKRKALLAEAAILRDGTLTEDQKTDAITRSNFILTEQTKLMRMGHQEWRAYELATERANKENDLTRLTRENDARRQLNQTLAESAKAQATFADMTGLAATKFEMARGSLKSLSDEQKAQMLVTLAAQAGLQKYASEFESLFAMQFQLQGDNDRRRAALRGGGMSGLDEQELKWAQEDAELRLRLIDLTDEQRAAYDKQRPAVEALRDSVRAFLKEQQALTTAEWFKGMARQTELLLQYNDASRVRLELQRQLEDQGFRTIPNGGDGTLENILDANDLQQWGQVSLERMRDLMGQMQGIISDGFKAAEEKGPMSFFSSVIGGVANMVADISRQIVSGMLTKTLLKAFPGMEKWYSGAQDTMNGLNAATLAGSRANLALATSYQVLIAQIKRYTEAAQGAQTTLPTAGGGSFSSIFGGLLSGGLRGLFGGKSGGTSGIVLSRGSAVGAGDLGSGFGLHSHRLGLDYVPYDGYKNTAHAGEAILSERDAGVWRAATVATPNGRELRGGGEQSNTYNLTVNLPPGLRNAEEVGPVVQRHLETMSRRQRQHNAHDAILPGGRQR